MISRGGMVRRAVVLAVWVALLPFTHAAKQARWWRDEPVRFFQANLSENFSTIDPARLVQQVGDFGGNVLLINLGGIAAQYPTEVEFHYRSRWLPEGRDLFGEVLRHAHDRKMRVIGRFDLSKTQKPVFDAHPEWFFRRVNGEPAIYNGLYSACINGGYYREHAPKILTEALTRYAVDGLFFNMFNNPSRDYDGVPMGPCQCDACAAKWRAVGEGPLPTDDRDPAYQEFLYACGKEVAAEIGALIHRLRPQAAFLTYIDEHTDVIIHESNTSVTRPLPLWPYSASDNVNRSLNSGRDKTVFNLCMSFVDYPWRFIHVDPDEIRLRLWQNLAHGGPPALVVLGSFDQEDRTSLVAAREIFAWHREHEQLYLNQESAARVLLLYGNGGADYRGFFRMLTEAHVPFAVSTDMDWVTDGRCEAYDLVIAPNGLPPALDSWVEQGGRLLVAGTTAPAAARSAVVGVREHARAAWRVQDHTLFPSLRDTNLVILDSEFTELKPVDDSALTLIPPALGAPPELVWLDKQETTTPGVWIGAQGHGRIAWIPWRPGEPYYGYSNPGHAGVVLDLLDHLLPRGRQLRTNAHPLIEITVMQQRATGRTFVHCVNSSGHSSTGYHAPIATGPIDISLAGNFSRARTLRSAAPIAVQRDGEHTRFSLPTVGAYEIVVLE